MSGGVLTLGTGGSASGLKSASAPGAKPVVCHVVNSASCSSVRRWSPRVFRQFVLSASQGGMRRVFTALTTRPLNGSSEVQLSSGILSIAPPAVWHMVQRASMIGRMSL
jgi:hypothetical protein